MKSKEEFKEFVKKHPELINYVKNGEMNWQKFYELYSLYDESDEAWGTYLKKRPINNESSNLNNHSSINNYGISDLINMLKNVKPEVLQQNINSVQKFLGFISEFVGDKNSNSKPNNRNIYTPRPTNRMFED